MYKVIAILILATLVSACSYNPVQYEQQRSAENIQHNKLMG